MPTKKPHYKLIAGAKPYTSAVLRFDCGTVTLKHGETLKGFAAEVFDVQWLPLLRKMLAYFDAHAGEGVTLTEPADRPLREEIERLEAERADRIAAQQAAKRAKTHHKEQHENEG